MQANAKISELQNILQETLDLATKLGATSAEASISNVEGISVGTRMKEVETVEFTNDGGLGICVFNGKHKGNASTADLSPDALKRTVEKAIQIAKYTSEDNCNGLAEKEVIATEIPDLDLYHPILLDTENAINIALEAETAAFDSDELIVNSDGANYNANLGIKAYANTHGINAGYAKSRYSLSCVLIAKNDSDMQRDYAYTISREADKLKAPAEVGKEAACNTVTRLNARKIATQKSPILFHKDIASGLFGHFISAISGGSLYRKSSFLLDSKGQKIFPDWLSIAERPHLQKGLASAPFDNEGVRTQDMDIVSEGRVQEYLLTSYSARKLGLVTNGHAGGTHNCIVSDTGQSDDDLLKELGTGLLVTELMGQGVSIVNGDYSRGAAGFWVEDGEIQYPVHEVTIAGNLKDMYQQIVAIGKEREIRGSLQTGGVLIEQMSIAGE
ncbi:MAG: metalloprotease PmbA [Pseudomonadota bacterium]